MSAPAAYAQLAADSAARWGRSFGVAVPVALVLAVMEHESSYNRLARRLERDGELSRGLMQVKESTVRDLGLRDPLELYQPATGIDYGTKYLAKQLKRYAGDVERAVAAYNAGTAMRSSSGAWVNQRYVDAVLRILKGAAGAAPPVLIAAAAGVLLVLALRSSSRRAA